ncbi:MAG: hypothetical protein Kow0047_04340 [Anaerolineae bacterium]
MASADPYFTPSDETLRAAWLELRSAPPGPLSGLKPALAELAGRSTPELKALLADVRAHPVPYTPEIDPNPSDLWPTAVRGLELLIALAGEVDQIDDGTGMAALRALHDHAEFLYCFNVTRSVPTRALNGAFLTLVGFYLTGLPLSADWRLAGMTRLISHLEPIGSALEQPGIRAAMELYGAALRGGIVGLKDQPLGEMACEIILWATRRARERGLPLIPAWGEYYFQITNEPLRHDLWIGIGIAGEEEFWAAIDLERPELATVREALERGDPEGARLAYAKHIARHTALRDTYFVGRQADLGRDGEIDLTEAEEICQDIFTLRAHMHHRHVFENGIDWTLILFDDIESNVSLNWHYHPLVLAMAFHHTRDQRYLEHLIRILGSWFEQSEPAPDRWQPLLQWRTLEVGNRAGQIWPMILMAAGDQPAFQAQTLLDMARSYLEHGRYLLAHQAMFGNNWFQVESTGLGVIALLFPEFKEAERFWRCALRRLEWINAVCFLPDGFQSEVSTTYHWFPVRGITALYELALLLGKELPAEMGPMIERMFQVYVDIAQPDLLVPLLNDCSPANLSVVDPLTLAAKLFPHREDFRYLASRRAEGEPPAYTSCAFPHAGYYVSRSGWDERALYVIFDAGYYGLGHQHEDKLNFVLHAGGRSLIHDPSIYQYKQDEFEPYWRGPRGHNTIMVDGKGQNRRLLERPEPRPDPDTVWVQGARCDFGQGWYRDGFATRTPGPEGHVQDQESLDRTIQHARALMIVKGEYVVLVDWVLGDGEHTVEQIFHLAPIVEASRQDGVRPGQAQVTGRGLVASAEPDLANVALISVWDGQPGVRIETGQMDPVRGWAALYGKQPAHDVTYSVRTTLPLTLPVVLWPHGLGDDALPEVRRVSVEPEAQAAAIEVATDRWHDLFVIAREPTIVRWASGSLEGQALWARLERETGARSITAVRAKALHLDGKEIFRHELPQDLVEEVLP